ncbi:MAG: uroporphyrinogen-III C-methyltransferase [Candidatus Omnitrophica bacterium]|nr:uroporphyrinogen-III C-methyltransferase [Candidatus Omnitrophota bacterium]
MGFVSLIGAGPGDPGLVTVRALEKLRTCEAVVHDRLIPYQLLDEVPAGAERIDVGKHPGKAKVPQEKIQEILIAKAREGKRVVRLKGGDPGIFGRVGEEIEALQDAGIPFEVVPGVTAGIAAAAAAGIPLTHRDIASSVTFVTGHEDPEREDSHLDWGEMARAGTLVFYMIGKHLPDIGERLIESGRPEATPALIVREASYPTQSIALTTLAELRDNPEVLQPGYPAVLIVGEVATMRSHVQNSLPLRDKLFVLTHPAEADDPLQTRLSQWGAGVLLCPSIRIDPVEESTDLIKKLTHMEDYDWVLFTSKNAVRAVREIFQELGWDIRRFGNVKIAAVGQATSRLLEDWGIVPDLVPENFTAEDLFRQLESEGEVEGRSFLFPCSEIARETLEKSILAGGGEFDRVTAYRTVAIEEPWHPDIPLSELSIDGICFTSSSTVRGFRARIGSEAFQVLANSTPMYSIGPKTSQTLAEIGARDIRESEVSDLEGLSDYIRRTQSEPGT